MEILRIGNLIVKFGDFLAVKNLSLNVERSKILGLLSSNGGKTTTIRVIFRMVPYKASWMHENSLLYLNLSGERNIRFFASLYGVRDEKRIGELLKLVNLYDFRKRLVRNLSGGMKRRAMLTCLIVHDPGILVLESTLKVVEGGG
jgi:ABC-2 type transport system ATP-binding protein